MKKIAIMQPTCFPWLGYFSLLNAVDEFIILDDVQFQKRSWQQRNRIKILNGEKWLTMSVHSKGKYYQHINKVTLINGEKIKKDILKTIHHAYSQSSNFKKIFPELEKTLLIKTENLADFNINFIKFICRLLKIETSLIRSSDIISSGDKDLRLVSICLNRAAGHYISPPGSEQYITEGNNFIQNGIKLSYFDFYHPVYNQLGEFFIGSLSVIDYIMNVDVHNVDHFLNCYKLR